MKRPYSVSVPVSVPVVLVLASLVLGAGLASSVSAKGWGHKHDPVSRLEKRIEAFDLEEESRVAIYRILDAARIEQRELRTEIREARKVMRSLLEQDEPDEAALMKQADVIGALKLQSRKRGLKTLLEVRSHLTQEQRDELRAGMKQRGKRGGCERCGGQCGGER